MTYGEVLQNAIAEAHMNPADLARKIGKSRSYVSQLMNGKVKEPSLTIAYKISDALGVPVQDFIDRMRESDKTEE